MKANEAPERIYIPRLISNGKLIHEWNNVPFKKWRFFFDKEIAENIEYIRTDVFIEKTCEFFEENIKEEDCKFGSSEWTELRAEYESIDSFIRAFKKYMKGE